MSANDNRTLTRATKNFDELTVDSVATLRGSSFPENVQRLWLSGYYGQGTPGDGELYRDSGDTTTADNGGTVFVDADGVRWRRNNQRAVSVEQFGAKPEGLGGFDNTDVFQSVFDYLGAQGGGVVFLEDATGTGYYVTETSYVKSNTTISGQGKGRSVIRPMADWNPDQLREKSSVFGVYLKTNVHFRDFSIFDHISAGDDEIRDMPCIHISGSIDEDGSQNDDTAPTWNDEFRNFSLLGMSFKNVSDSGVKITGNYNRNAVDVKAWTNTIRIDRCDFEESNNENGQLVHFDAQPGRILINSCSFIGPFSARKSNDQVRYALRFQSARDVSVTNCYFYNWDGKDGASTGRVSNRWNGAGIHCQRSGWGVRNLTVTGCVFYRTGCGVSTRHGNSNINIVGNTFEDLFMACLQVTDGNDYNGDLDENFRPISINFSGNTCRDWGNLNNNDYKWAIHSETHKFDYLQISGNTFIGDVDSPEEKRYIKTTDTNTGETLKKLSVHGNTLKGLRIEPNQLYYGAYSTIQNTFNTDINASTNGDNWTRFDSSDGSVEIVAENTIDGEVKNFYTFSGSIELASLTTGNSVEIQIADSDRSHDYLSNEFTASSDSEWFEIFGATYNQLESGDGAFPKRAYIWVKAIGGAQLNRALVSQRKMQDTVIQ